MSPGYWMVSTSDDDISELRSYESNDSDGVEEEENAVDEIEESEYESEVEESDIDLEVMEILRQTEHIQHTQTELEAVDIASGSSEKQVSFGKKNHSAKPFQSLFYSTKANEMIPSTNDGHTKKDEDETQSQNTANNTNAHNNIQAPIGEQINVQVHTLHILFISVLVIQNLQTKNVVTFI